VVGAWISVVAPVLSCSDHALRRFVYSYLILAPMNLSYDQAFEELTVEFGAADRYPHLLPPEEFHLILGMLDKVVDTSLVDDPLHNLRLLEAQLSVAMATYFKVSNGAYGAGWSLSLRNDPLFLLWEGEHKLCVEDRRGQSDMTQRLIQ
jgi:hypothetical protein